MYQNIVFDLDGTLADSGTGITNSVKYALRQCTLRDLSSVLMAGDREHDMTGAKQVGIASADILSGYGSREEVVHADAEKVQDILAYV